jgi:hypothetical protein
MIFFDKNVNIVQIDNTTLLNVWSTFILDNDRIIVGEIRSYALFYHR